MGSIYGRIPVGNAAFARHLTGICVVKHRCFAGRRTGIWGSIYGRIPVGNAAFQLYLTVKKDGRTWVVARVHGGGGWMYWLERRRFWCFLFKEIPAAKKAGIAGGGKI